MFIISFILVFVSDEDVLLALGSIKGLVCLLYPYIGNGFVEVIIINFIPVSDERNVTVFEVSFDYFGNDTRDAKGDSGFDGVSLLVSSELNDFITIRGSIDVF